MKTFWSGRDPPEEVFYPLYGQESCFSPRQQHLFLKYTDIFRSNCTRVAIMPLHLLLQTATDLGFPMELPSTKFESMKKVSFPLEILNILKLKISEGCDQNWIHTGPKEIQGSWRQPNGQILWLPGKQGRDCTRIFNFGHRILTFSIEVLKIPATVKFDKYVVGSSVKFCTHIGCLHLVGGFIGEEQIESRYCQIAYLTSFTHWVKWNTNIYIKLNPKFWHIFIY